MQETAASEGGHRPPGITDWLLNAVSLMFLMMGMYIAFFIPLMAGIWGMVSLRKSGKESRKAWILYTAVAVLLFLFMLFMQLFLTPWGEPEKVPMAIAANAMLAADSA